MILYLTYWFPAWGRAPRVAFLMTSVPIAAVVGSPLSGALLTFGGRYVVGYLRAELAKRHGGTVNRR
jgi:MFS family permease